MFSRLVVLVLYLVDVHAQTIVDTEYGQVRGHVVDVDNGRQMTSVEVFYGIPFAKPPLGELRFATPERSDPWTGVLEGDTLGDVCPQSVSFIRITNPGWERDKVSEDCLHLNVYVPTEGTGPFPVMVWLFGGSYQTGANVQYPGHFLASRGVIVVTVNYRVNTFGFAFTGNDACPGNAGMYDQNLGIQFVVDNIANFGGDPTRITVFGESAGATSTSLHIVSPLSKDLFHQAILESGFEMMYITINHPDSHPEDYTRQMGEQLGCSTADDYEMMDCLRSLTWQNIFVNSSVTCTPGYICLGMAPVVDGPGGFLPEMPVDLRDSGQIMDGPLLAGINEQDGSLFLPIVAPAILFDDCCNRSYFSHVIKNNIVAYFGPRLDNVTSDNLYHALDYNYSPWPYIYDNVANGHKLAELVTDGSFGVFWDRQIKEHSAIAPTYGYVFDRRLENSPLDSWVGTTHAAEIPLVWGFPLFHFNEAVVNDSKVGSPANYTDADVQYSIYMQELWTNFAKFGNPTPSPVDDPLGGSTTWPNFEFDDMNVLHMGSDDIRVVKEWAQKNYAFWNDYVIWMAGDQLGIGDDWPEDGFPSQMIQEAIYDGLRQVFQEESDW